MTMIQTLVLQRIVDPLVIYSLALQKYIVQPNTQNDMMR